MAEETGFQTLGDIFKNQQTNKVKPPAYQWQDFALQVIKDLSIPAFKRNSVFKICKEKPRAFVETCVADTKELCKSGEMWKYFFKVVADKSTNTPSVSPPKLGGDVRKDSGGTKI